jgi:hypothetical protein
MLLGLLLASVATAQRVTPPRAAAPRLLLDFEAPAAAALWEGLPAQRVASPASSGQRALAITFPPSPTGADERPRATLPYADGRGFPTADWSHYGALTFDAWLDGATTESVIVEFRDDAGRHLSKTLALAPHTTNTFTVSPQDAGPIIIDTARLREISLIGYKPKRAFTATFDNFRLIPGERPPLCEFDLAYPNYRGLVFPPHEAAQAAVYTECADYGLNPRLLLLTLTATRAGLTRSARTTLTGTSATLAVSLTDFPPGPLELTLTLTDTRDGKPLGTQTWPLRKLTPGDVDALPVYLDEHNNTIAGGQPFFPIGLYCDTRLDRMADITDSPFNTLLCYATNSEPRASMQQFLDTLQRHNKKLIYSLNDIHPGATKLDASGWEGVRGNAQITSAVVQTFRNHPALLAWYINDERPVSILGKMQSHYRQVSAADPAHPCLSTIFYMPDVRFYPSATDVMGVDPYPLPENSVADVADAAEVARSGVRGHKPAWLVPQAFGWYQYRSGNRDRSHLPTPRELHDGRAPSREELRCMTYLALAHGAKGLLYYSYFDVCMLPDYAQRWAELKQLAAEVNTLAPALLAPEGARRVTCTPHSSDIHTRLMQSQGRLYLIAVNAGKTARTCTFNPGQPCAPNVEVLFEDRALPGGSTTSFTDNFAPLAVHVYTLMPRGDLAP